MLRLVQHPYYYPEQDVLEDLLLSALLSKVAAAQADAANSSTSRDRFWTSKIDLQGFRPEEIHTKREALANDDKDGKSGEALVIHARHVNGADYNEVKRTMPLPQDIDPDKLKLHFSKQGILHLQAPFKQPDDKSQLHQSNDFDPAQHLLASTSRTQISGDVFRADFNLAGFKPEEITIQVRDERQILVEATHEGEDTRREMRRVVVAPEGTDMAALASQFNASEAILRLEAPYKQPELPKSKQIPLQCTHNSLKVHSETAPSADT